MIDRRREVRTTMPGEGVRGTLRPGCRVQIVDASPGGALVHVERPLRPGGRVHMQVTTTSGTVTVTARVLRCAVWTLHPQDGVTYRGALQFDDRCELFRVAATHPGSRVPGIIGTATRRAGHALPGDNECTSAASPRCGK